MLPQASVAVYVMVSTVPQVTCAVVVADVYSSPIGLRVYVYILKFNVIREYKFSLCVSMFLKKSRIAFLNSLPLS